VKIFSDTKLTDAALRALLEGADPHELVFSSQLSSSVLAKGAPDPGLAQAQIAFGQPDADAVLASKELQWVHLTSAGYTRYDTAEFRAAATERGLVLTNSSAVYAEACAEHALSFMLAQARHLPTALASRAESGSPEWLGLRHSSALLKGQRAIIFGYGAIAARLAAMLAPFHMDVSAVRRRARGDESVRIVTVEACAEELGEADHVINILPENAASTRFFSAHRFDQVKAGAVFYNIGRGATVDQEALAAALRSGRLAAAWLDVTTPEPLPPDHPLWQLPNCFITPHTAGGQQGEPETLVRHFLENLRRFEAGVELHDRVV